jgi:hypothetical protein
MGTFENPDLRASAAWIVCLNHFASSAALRRKVGFDQPKSYPTPKPRFFVYIPVLMKLLAIRLGYQPKSFWPGTRIALHSHSAKSPKYGDISRWLTIAKSLVMSLVEGSTLWGAANIFIKQTLRGLFAFLFARVAYDSVRTRSIPQYQPRVPLAGLWCNRKLDADSPPVVSDHSGSVLLRGTFRRTLNF